MKQEEEVSQQLVHEAGSTKGFAIGVTEDAPPKALERSLEIISKVIRGGDQPRGGGVG